MAQNDPGARPLSRPRAGRGACPAIARRCVDRACLANAHAQASLLETVRTGPQTSLSLVRVDHTEYLLVSAPGGAQLAEYQSADHPDDGASA